MERPLGQRPMVKPIDGERASSVSMASGTRPSLRRQIAFNTRALLFVALVPTAWQARHAATLGSGLFQNAHSKSSGGMLCHYSKVSK